MAEWISQNPTYGRGFLDTVVAAMKTDPGAALIVAGKIRLSTNPAFDANFNAAIADLTPDEATFTGYTAGGYAVSLSAVLNLGPTALGSLAHALIVCSADGTSQTCYGYWVDDGANVILMEAFDPDNPPSFELAGDFLDLDVVFPLQATQPAA